MFVRLLYHALAPLAFIFVVLTAPASAADLYVAPAGTDIAPGTFAEPTTLARALTLIAPGDTIYLRGGTYAFSTQLTIAASNSGAGPAARKHLFAYVPPGGAPEVPQLDFSSQPYGTGTNPRGLQLNGHHWHVRGLVAFGSADNGIFVAGNHNIVERCITHSNRDSGLQISRASSAMTDISQWPSYNLILNCDSYDNHDSPPGGGENADGFACKLTSGPGNVFRGCVARNNIDDGWDLFTNDSGPIGSVIIDQCIAYHNGTLTDGTQNEAGDRNGFKLGGSGHSVVHTVTRSIAFGNGKNGFTWNSNPAAMRIFHNVAWDNAEGNYKFDQPAPVFLNNISLWTTGSGKNDRYGGNSGIATGPSNLFWFASGTPRSRNDQGLQVSAASFRSLTVPAGGFVRRADGSLDLGDFARLVAGSPLINAGTLPDSSFHADLVYYSGNYYEGAADIGLAEQYLATAPFFTLQPQGATVFGGGSVTFSAAADGTAPITYRWFHGDDPVPDATATTLTLTGLTPAQSGDYTLRATNSVTTVTSAVATLVVLIPVAPSVTTPPTSQTIPLGQSVTFSVTADGTAPFTYQWFDASGPIPDATEASFTIDAVTLADAGDYTVIVTNAAGPAPGATATLAVDARPIAPAITTSPVNTTAVSGASATLTVAASGTPPLSYQWRRRGAPIPGETTLTLNFNPARLIDASDYDVVVSNAAGSVTSAPASLVVSSAPPATLVADTFADGTRATQSLPASLAWWTSAGSGNFTASTGAASLVASSSRTVLGYFTASPAQAITLTPGQTLTFSATLRWSGFDDSATAGLSNFHVGLLRSVANPAATSSGTGYVPVGAPNTQARVTGDFGSSQPSSNVFSLYQGYTAFAQARTTAVAAPVAFRVRDLANASLLGSTAAFTALPGDTPLPAPALAINTPYRVMFAVARTADGMELGYALYRVSDNALMAVGTAHDPAATCTAFDTFAFYLGKASATPTYTVTFTGATLALSSEPALDIAAWRAGWSLTGPSAADLADPDADGLSNLLEYALGLSPTLADLDPAHRPLLTPSESPAGLVFRYTRPKSAADLDYFVETSTDLLTWSPAESTPVLESETPATETHTVALPAGPAVYARLRVTLLP